MLLRYIFIVKCSQSLQMFKIYNVSTRTKVYFLEFFSSSTIISCFAKQTTLTKSMVSLPYQNTPSSFAFFFIVFTSNLRSQSMFMLSNSDLQIVSRLANPSFFVNSSASIDCCRERMLEQWSLKVYFPMILCSELMKEDFLGEPATAVLRMIFFPLSINRKSICRGLLNI